MPSLDNRLWSMLPSIWMEPQDELQQLLERQAALKQELTAKKKALQEAQRRQRDTLTRQIRRAQARVSTADRKRRTRRLILLGAYLDRRMDTDAALKADVMASLTASLEHDRDRTLFGDDLRPTSSDAQAAPAAALDPDPQTPPIEGWTPRQLDTGVWGAVLDGAPVAALSASDQLRGTSIRVTDRRGDTWTTTVQEVVSRHDTEIVVTTRGRPRR